MTLELTPVDELLAEAWLSWFYELLSDQDPPVTLEEFIGPRLAWEARAACRGKGPDLFFPAPGDDVDPAQAICARCAVRQECLEVALSSVEGGAIPGIWGGTSARERARLRRAMA